MRAIAIAIILLMPSYEAPAPMGIGSCYELKPLCMSPQVPLCICDTQNRCFWVCKPPQ
jgi:hypothetical protein